MKREINCLDCARKWQQSGISDDFDGLKINFPIEHKKYVHGKAKGDYRCDGCNKEIKQGEECVAFSLFTDEIHYYPWESSYIEDKS